MKETEVRVPKFVSGLLLFFVLVIVLMIIHAVYSKDTIKKDYVKQDDHGITVYFEQQMRFDEIARFYAQRGEYKSIETCIKEEGQWWREVSFDCSFSKEYSCRKLDETEPFRIKMCEIGKGCSIQYFNVEEKK